jgi:hypothetical protein
MLKKIAGVVTVVLLPAVAMAAPPDFSGMTGQIDWTTAIAAILLIAGGLAGVYVVLTGSSMVNGKLAKGK